MELIVSTAIQHAIYLQDVRIGVSARELVPRAVEAKDELLDLSWLRGHGGRVHRSFLGWIGPVAGFFCV